MPKFSQEQITPNQEASINPQRQYQTQVVAKPVNTTVTPAQSNLMRLSSALDQFMPAANQYMQKKVEEEGQANLEKGQQAYLRGDSLAPEADPWYSKGYLNLQGSTIGDSIVNKMTEEADKHRNDPTFNPQKFSAEFYQKETQGITDPHILQTLNAKLAQGVLKLQDDFQKYHLDETRTSERNAAFALATDSAKNFGNDPKQFRTWFDTQFYPQQRGMGRDTTDIAHLATSALIQQAMAAKDPDRLNAADVAGPDGTKLSDHPEIAHQLLQARTEIIKAQRQVLAEAANEANKAVGENWSKLTHDPNVKPEELEQFIKDNSHGINSFFGTDDKVKSAYDEVYRRKEQLIQFGQFSNAESVGMLSGMSSLPGYREYVALRRAPTWDVLTRTPVGSPEHNRALTALINHVQTTKVSDPRLDSMLSGMSSAMPITDKTTGKEVLPSDFEMAYEIYTGLNKSGNYNLIRNAMGENTSRLLAIMDDQMELGRSSTDALKEAQKATSPSAQRLISGLSLQQKSEIKADITSRLTGLMATHHWSNATNIAPVVERLADMASQEYSKGFASPKAATEFVTKQFFSNHAQVEGYWVQMPDFTPTGRVADPRTVSTGLSEYIKKYSTDLKADKGNLIIQLQPGHGSYLVGDPYDPQTFRQVPVDALVEQGREKLGISSAQLAAAGNAFLAMKSGKITPQQIDSHWDDFQTSFLSGQMDTATYQKAYGMKLQSIADAHTKAIEDIRNIRAKVAAQVNVGDPLKDPYIKDLSRQIPQPGGRNLDTLSYVKQYLNQDPTSALIMGNEGLRVSRYLDPNGKDWNIGIGYNMSARSRDQVKADLDKAGVAPHLIDSVIDGKAEINPRQAVRLFQNTRGAYEDSAKKALGEETWRILPSNLKAVFTDLAYATGDPSKFKGAIASVKAGDFKALGDNLTISYKPPGSDKLVPDWRRIGLLRAMAKGTDAYSAYIDLARNSNQMNRTN